MVRRGLYVSVKVGVPISRNTGIPADIFPTNWLFLGIEMKLISHPFRIVCFKEHERYLIPFLFSFEEENEDNIVVMFRNTDILFEKKHLPSHFVWMGHVEKPDFSEWVICDGREIRSWRCSKESRKLIVDSHLLANVPLYGRLYREFENNFLFPAIRTFLGRNL